jgi:hypothetical protein
VVSRSLAIVGSSHPAVQTTQVDHLEPLARRPGEWKAGARNGHGEDEERSPEATRIKMATLLNARLADGIDLILQAKQAHWNVKGPEFIALHEC